MPVADLHIICSTLAAVHARNGTKYVSARSRAEILASKLCRVNPSESSSEYP